MFEGDPVIAEIQEEGRKIREAERRDAQRGFEIVILLDTDHINILPSSSVNPA